MPDPNLEYVCAHGVQWCRPCYDSILDELGEKGREIARLHQALWDTQNVVRMALGLAELEKGER